MFAMKYEVTLSLAGHFETLVSIPPPQVPTL